MEHVVISPCLRCGDSEESLRLPSFAAIEEIVTSCESWLWSTTRFTVAIVICSIDNSNTDVVHLTKEHSCLLHFLTHGAEIECNGTLPSVKTEDSLLCNAVWEKVGSASENHSRRN